MIIQPGIDRLGRAVKAGDQVRLFAIRPSILKRLATDEHAYVSSMLGQTMEVVDVSETGLVWVSLTWVRQNGSSEIHVIAVDAEAIELIA